jgi:hypothetical protein
MEQRLFFDGIHIAGDQLPKNIRVQAPFPIFPHIAESPLACFYLTAVAAQHAADMAVVQFFVQIGFHSYPFEVEGQRLKV